MSKEVNAIDNAEGAKKYKAEIMEALYSLPMGAISTDALRFLNSYLPNDNVIAEVKNLKINHNGNTIGEIYGLDDDTAPNIMREKINKALKNDKGKYSVAVENLINSLTPKEHLVMLDAMVKQIVKGKGGDDGISSIIELLKKLR